MTGNKGKDLLVLFLRGEKRRKVREIIQGQELDEVMAPIPQGWKMERD